MKLETQISSFSINCSIKWKLQLIRKINSRQRCRTKERWRTKLNLNLKNWQTITIDNSLIYRLLALLAILLSNGHTPWDKSGFKWDTHTKIPTKYLEPCKWNENRRLQLRHFKITEASYWFYRNTDIWSNVTQTNSRINCTDFEEILYPFERCI